MEQQKAIWSYVSECCSAGGHMDLRFCMLERRGRGGRGQCGCGFSFVHMEGSAVVEAKFEDNSLAAVPCTFRTE